jgi:hypothetical protein
MNDPEDSFFGWNMLKVSDKNRFLGHLTAAIHRHYTKDTSADSPDVMWAGIRNGREGYLARSEEVRKTISNYEGRTVGRTGEGDFGFMADSYRIDKIAGQKIDAPFNIMVDPLDIVGIENESILSHPGVVSEAIEKTKAEDKGFRFEVVRLKGSHGFPASTFTKAELPEIPSVPRNAALVADTSANREISGGK